LALLPVPLLQPPPRLVRQQQLVDLLVVVLEEVPLEVEAVKEAVALDQFQPSMPLTKITGTVVEAAEIVGRFGRRSG
jgi:hypothetical protein